MSRSWCAVVAVICSYVGYCNGAHLYLIGDSTMMPSQGSIVGWGAYAEPALAEVGLHVSVVNDAVSGMSARTTFEQSKFQAVVTQIIAGDYVLIELGRNDYVKDSNIGRHSCPPDNGINTTCMNGTKTFEAYIIDAATSMQAKNATVILASLLPLNPYGAPIWDFDPKESTPIFVAYMADAAKRTHANYLDLYALISKQYHTLPEQTVRSFFGANDSVHTNADGARYIAKQVAQALVPIFGARGAATQTSPANAKGGVEPTNNTARQLARGCLHSDR